jgi:hypothetical protein
MGWVIDTFLIFDSQISAVSSQETGDGSRGLLIVGIRESSEKGRVARILQSPELL